MLTSGKLELTGEPLWVPDDKTGYGYKEAYALVDGSIVLKSACEVFKLAQEIARQQNITNGLVGDLLLEETTMGILIEQAQEEYSQTSR